MSFSDALWFLAPVTVGLALALLLRAAVGWRVPLPAPTTRGPGLAVLWAAAAALLGPVCLGITAAASAAVAESRWGLLEAAGGALVLSTFGWAFALLIGLPFYMPILLVWARVGPALGRWEASRRGLALSMALLALPLALATFALNAWPVGQPELGPAAHWPPWRHRLADGVRFGLAAGVGTWFGLLTARLLVPPLRVGAFSPPGAGTA
jgi:hypothetical protein